METTPEATGKSESPRERELALERASIALRNGQFRNNQLPFEFAEAMAAKVLSPVTPEHLDAVALDSMLRPAAPKLGEMPTVGRPSWPNSPAQSRPRNASSSQNSNGMSRQQKLPDGAPSVFSENDYIRNDPASHFGDLLSFGFDHLINDVMGSGARTTGPDAEFDHDNTTVPSVETKNSNYTQPSQAVSRTVPAQPFATSVAPTVANGYPVFGDGVLPSTGIDFKLGANADAGLDRMDMSGNGDEQQTGENVMMDNGDMDWTLWDDMVNQYGTSGYPTNLASTAGPGNLGLVHWF